MYERMPENQNPINNLLRKTGIASLAVSIAIGVSELPQQTSDEVVPVTSQEPIAQETYKSPPRRHYIRANSTTSSNTAVGSARIQTKYWYGTSEELNVIKTLGNTKNAKLTYEYASKQPWYSKHQMYCLDRLWFKESKFNEHADNPTSSAYGVPQALPGEKMSAAGSDWHNNATIQIEWGIDDYIEDRYKTPCNAWDHSQSMGWY